MRIRSIHLGWLLSLLLLTANARGQASGIYVEYWNGSAWVHVPGHPDRLKNPPDPGYDSGSDIEIVNANNVTYRVFAVSPSTTDIGTITVNAADNSTQPRLLVGRFTFLTEPTVNQRLDAAGARDLQGVVSSTGKVRLQVWTSRDVLSTGIDVHEIVRVDVDGDVLGPISHRPVTGTPALGVLRVIGSIDPASGGVVAYAGNISLLQVVSGDMLCGTSALQGYIDNISVLDGNVGGLTETVAIEAAKGIRKLAASSVFAVIDAGDGSLDDSLWYMETTSGGFTGSLECRFVNSELTPSGIDLAGDLDADLVITQNLDEPLLIGGDLKSERLVQIGRLLNTNGAVTLPSNGLKGQIIVKASNEASGGWIGHVTVGTIVLSGDEYATKAADLGGGAVGLVPFSTHLTSCVPEHDTIKVGTPTSITLQFYGPVKPEDDTKMPVKVYRYTFGTFDNALDVTDDFDVVYPTDRKQVQIVPDIRQFRPRYRYRIVPIISSPDTDETLLLCDNLLTSSSVPVDGDEYWVDVEIAMGMLDLNGNEWVDEPDAALWCNDPQDFDGSGAADARDLIILTDALGTPVGGN